MRLLLLPGRFAVCRLAPDAPVPAWAVAGPLSSVTRTEDELSVVCAEVQVPDGVRGEPGWRALRVAGTLDFGLVGVLKALVTPLAEAGISVFALSTFDTDYLLLRDLEGGAAALEAAGHEVER
jgi:uncharacterized protein